VVALSTEDVTLVPDAAPIVVEARGRGSVARFARPGAVVFMEDGKEQR
jgi:hypothetical protein